MSVKIETKNQMKNKNEMRRQRPDERWVARALGATACQANADTRAMRSDEGAAAHASVVGSHSDFQRRQHALVGGR